MLTLNLAGLSEAELRNIVADHCSFFGCLTTVKVLRPEGRREYGIALVEMSSSREANNLARKFGDSQYGSRLVVINLYHGNEAAVESMQEQAQNLTQAVNVFKLVLHEERTMVVAKADRPVASVTHLPAKKAAVRSHAGAEKKPAALRTVT